MITKLLNSAVMIKTGRWILKCEVTDTMTKIYVIHG
jgi:hypothetical protein